ncbi:hypothetical protein CAPTEDRAFT_97699 [Capitella teleta]|uniref:RING-type domain-containing protein n=1 Tax=Capitella teleta TaxID=283909 RepID=R7T6P5_CAPTE|nr:hypothetical protein CAPTEDRAFT_97699 [Capitella teleta]|eukprot:ELT89195.1 hypothetical protein CAPTEDRAFT_97699 [Capitella teleta]
MNIETLRLASFDQWPSDAGARPIALAAAGFYHSGGPNSCEVTCFSCDLSVSQWEPHQDPLAVHRQLAPHCPFLNGKTGAASRAVPENISLEVYDENLSLEDYIRTRPNLGFLNRMRSMKKRTATYEDWTYGHRQSANALAEAGFFFTGVQDHTQCAFCRGVLHSWESTDNPWEEHKKHFPSCPFVLGRQIDQKKKAPETIMTAATVEAHDLNSGELRVWYNMPLIYFKTDERRHVKRKRVNEHIFCEVCMHRDCNVVFLPCRHLVCCTLCTDGLKRCPICHTRIKRIVSVFVFDE